MTVFYVNELNFICLCYEDVQIKRRNSFSQNGQKATIDSSIFWSQALCDTDVSARKTKIRVLLPFHRYRTCDLHSTSWDALPLSYRRLVGARPLNYVYVTNILHNAMI